MISINNEGEVRMSGTMVDLMTDMSTLLHDYRKMMEQDYGKEAADRMLVLIGKVAVHEPWRLDSPAVQECHEEMRQIVELIAEDMMRKEKK